MPVNPSDGLSFESFKKLAQDTKLSKYEKIGFPDSYRENKEALIFKNLCSKATNLNKINARILDIGSGCSDLPLLIAQNALEKRQKVTMVDSNEMLSLIEDHPNVNKYPGKFPECLKERSSQLSYDVIIAYSVLQYVFAEGNIFSFLDTCLELLEDNGQMILGDIPNITMRKRFFSSKNGIQSHFEYTGIKEPPVVRFNCLETSKIDDSIVLSILSRARAQGFHAWIYKQSDDLPMANRREDIMIEKP